MYVQVVKNTAYLLISQLPPIICKLGPPRKEQKRCFQPFFKVCLRKLCVQVRTSFISIYIYWSLVRIMDCFYVCPKGICFGFQNQIHILREDSRERYYGDFFIIHDHCAWTNLGLLFNTFTNLRNFEWIEYKGVGF